MSSFDDSAVDSGSNFDLLGKIQCILGSEGVCDLEHISKASGIAANLVFFSFFLVYEYLEKNR